MHWVEFLLIGLIMDGFSRGYVGGELESNRVEMGQIGANYFELRWIRGEYEKLVCTWVNEVKSDVK